MSGDDSTTTWEMFKEKFMWHHFPSCVRDEKENAFYKFEQNDLSVDEYITTFTELVRHVSFLQRQDDPKWRTNQLIERTRKDLRL